MLFEALFICGIYMFFSQAMPEIRCPFVFDVVLPCVFSSFFSTGAIILLRYFFERAREDADGPLEEAVKWFFVLRRCKA